MTSGWDDVCSLNTDEWNENEQRLFGGFVIESELEPENVDLIQAELPVGAQCVAHALNEDIDTDLRLDDALEPRTHADCVRGFRTAKDLSDNWGFSKNLYTGSVDCLLVTDGTVYVIEMKTRGQRIEGMHDVYEGFGQVLMNHDRFRDDYPSIGRDASIKPLLLTEDSNFDVTLIEPVLRHRGVGFFDPIQGGMLIHPV